MKPNFVKTDNPEFDSILLKLNTILTSIDSNNFNFRMINGVTDPVANTQRLFRHNMNPRPVIPIAIKGDIYFENIDNTNIDIRSAQTSMPFIAMLMG